MSVIPLVLLVNVCVSLVFTQNAVKFTSQEIILLIETFNLRRAEVQPSASNMQPLVSVLFLGS